MILLFNNRTSGHSLIGNGAHIRVSRQAEDPDVEEIPTDVTPQGGRGGGFIQRVLGIIRGLLNGGRAFLSGSTQRIIEYVTSILGNLVGGTSGNLRMRTTEAERELAKVAKQTERLTARN